MKKNWLLIPVTLCLVLVPASIVLMAMRLHEKAAAVTFIACGAILYCAFPPVYEKFRTSATFRVPWKIIFWLHALGMSPIFLFITLVPLLDITTNAQRLGGLFGPGVFGTMNFDRAVVITLVAVMVAGLAVALARIIRHVKRPDGVDAPFAALVSFFAAYSAAVILQSACAVCYFKFLYREGSELENAIVFTVFSFMTYQVFSFAYLGRNRKTFASFPVLALLANIVAFAACCTLILLSGDFELFSIAAVILPAAFVFIRDGEGVPAWSRAFAMASLAGIALLSFTQKPSVQHPEHVYSLAGAFLAGWTFFAFATAFRMKKGIAVSIVKCTAWVIAAALIAANELYYGSFTDRNGVSHSVLLHLALAAAGYTAALAFRSRSDILAGFGAFIRRPAVIAPAAFTVLLAAGAVFFAGNAVMVSAEELAGIRLGADASALRTTGQHPQGGLVVRSMIDGRDGPERRIAPETWVNVSDGCASTVLGKRAPYVEAVHIALDRMSPRRVLFNGKRLPTVLKTPEDLVVLCEEIGAELRTENPLSNPIEEGGPLYFVLKREKGYPSILRLEYDNYRPVYQSALAASSGRLRAVRLALGVNQQCGTAEAPGAPNRIFTRGMVKNINWLGSDARYAVKKDISNVRAAPAPDSRTVSTVTRGMILPARWRYSGTGGEWLMCESGWVAVDALVPEGAPFERASYGDTLVPTEDDYAALSEMAKRSCAERRPLSVPRDSIWRVNTDRRITFAARLIAEGDAYRLEADGRAFIGGSYTRGEITELGDETLNAVLRGGTKAPAGPEGESVPGMPVRVFGRIQVEDACLHGDGPGMLPGVDPDTRGYVRFALERIEKI
ncbi:MAG: hypothetical protein KBA61_16045 [Spirochaetes bacterium]|nr:hypothetical protein [Spirochaetota bacterium]